jgi:hypothetical protein
MHVAGAAYGSTALESSEPPRKWPHHVIAYDMKSELVKKAGNARTTPSICGVACVCRAVSWLDSNIDRKTVVLHFAVTRVISWNQYRSARETYTLSCARWPRCALPRVSTGFDACMAMVAPIRLSPCRQLYCAFYPRELFI